MSCGSGSWTGLRTSEGGFLETSCRVQLEGSPPEVYQLSGEILYFYFLIVSAKDSTGETTE